MNYLLGRWGWYQYRKGKGHPISLWRAFFDTYPRFGSYDLNELLNLVDRPVP